MNPHPPPADPDRTAHREPSAPPGTVDVTADSTRPRLPDPPAGAPAISGYAITAEIAKGGMGRVYAGIDLTLDREVAIKTLLPGANPERFVTESKITAKLPHPNIPPVYTLGTLPDGGPFLAMKYVRGQTLSDQLKARPSPSHDLSRFVQVFEQVAQAVGFAHSRGVIHRDLKPANVMVGEFGEVQVMDWGLAKVSGERRDVSPPVPGDTGGLTSRRSPDADHTQAGAIMGTPGYMAPEQARGEAADARADVFALGAILATMLTGQPAFVGTAAERVKKAANAELSDAFARLDACGADAELIGVARRCLAADRDARPADGRAVAAEVGAYRTGVEARLRQAETERAEAVVRATETRKRQRVIVWASGIAVGILLAGVLGVALALFEAQRQERFAKGETVAKEAARVEAVAAQGVAEEKKREAEKRLTQVEKGVESLATILANINPRSEDPNAPALYDRLRENALRVAAELDTDAVGDPLAVARLQTILGTVLRNLGEYPKAIDLLERAVATRRALLGERDEYTLNAVNRLARAYSQAGRQAEAVERYRPVLNELTIRLGADHPDTRATATDLALALQAAGQVREALPIFEAVLAGTRRVEGAESTATCTAVINLAAARLALGDVSAAVAEYERARDAYAAKLGPDHVDTLTILNGLGRAYLRANRVPEAIKLMEGVRDVRVAKLGPAHPATLQVQIDLAAAYAKGGKRGDAIALGEQVVAGRRAKLGDEHPDTLTAMSNLAVEYQHAGRYEEAIRLDRQVLDARRKVLGPTHPDTLTSVNNLANGYGKLSRYAESVRMLEDLRPVIEKELGADHPHTLAVLSNLADVYAESGKLELAIPLFEKVCQARLEKFGPTARETMDSCYLFAKALHKKREYRRAAEMAQTVYDETAESLGPSHPATLKALNELASIRLDAGETQAAIKLYEQLRKGLGDKPNDPEALTLMFNLAVGYNDLGDYPKAIEVLEPVLAARRGLLGNEHLDTLRTQCALGAVYRAAGKPAKSLELVEPAHALLRKSLGDDNPETLVAANNLAGAYRETGKHAEAIELFRQVYERRSKTLGAEDDDTLTTLNNLALTYQDAGRTADALAALDACRSGYLKTLPADHPRALICTVNLAVARHRAGQSKEALALLEEAAPLVEKKKYQTPAATAIIMSLARIYEEGERYADAEAWRTKWVAHLKATRGENSMDVVMQAYNLAEDQEKQQKWAEAERTYRECAAALEKAKPDLWSAGLIQGRIGVTLMARGKTAEAEPLLVKGYEMLVAREKGIPKESAFRIPEMLDKLIELYTAMEKPDEVKKYKELRAKYPAAKGK